MYPRPYTQSPHPHTQTQVNTQHTFAQTQTHPFSLLHEFWAGGMSRLVCENKLDGQGGGGALLYYSA
jgi:hypothetical protein